MPISLYKLRCKANLSPTHLLSYHLSLPPTTHPIQQKKKKMNAKVVPLAICVVLLVVAVSDEVEAAVTCNPVQLSPCASAITSSGNPTEVCCAKIKEQSPCLCEYMKNPYLQRFINSPGAKKVANSCGTPFPKC